MTTIISRRSLAERGFDVERHWRSFTDHLWLGSLAKTLCWASLARVFDERLWHISLTENVPRSSVKSLYWRIFTEDSLLRILFTKDLAPILVLPGNSIFNLFQNNLLAGRYSGGRKRVFGGSSSGGVEKREGLRRRSSRVCRMIG